MSGLWVPGKPKLVLPGRPAPEETKRPGMAADHKPALIQCRKCGATQEHRQRRPLDPQTLAETRCVVCGGKGAEVTSHGR